MHYHTFKQSYRSFPYLKWPITLERKLHWVPIPERVKHGAKKYSALSYCLNFPVLICFLGNDYHFSSDVQCKYQAMTIKACFWRNTVFSWKNNVQKTGIFEEFKNKSESRKSLFLYLVRPVLVHQISCLFFLLKYA